MRLLALAIDDRTSAPRLSNPSGGVIVARPVIVM